MVAFSEELLDKTFAALAHPASVAVASDWIETHRKYWTQQLDSLAAYLERP